MRSGFPSSKRLPAAQRMEPSASAKSLALSASPDAQAPLPCVEFTTLAPFGGGVVPLRAWPKVKRDLDSGVERNRIISYIATLRGSLV